MSLNIPKLTTDLNAHQNLDNQPSLSASELKQAWDKPVNDIKTYINSILVDGIQDAIDTISGSIDTAITTKLQAIYPVGRVIYSESEINPALIFGFGTWELTGQGQFIVGYDSTNSKFNAGGKIGGSLTKYLQANQIPTLNFTVGSVGAGTKGNFDYSASPASFTREAIMTLSTGTQNAQIPNYSQQALDITPTYKTMYMYKRVS